MVILVYNDFILYDFILFILLFLGLIQMIVFVSLAISNFISGYFLEAFGFLAAFILISALTTAALLLAVFQLVESLPKDKRAESHSSLLLLPKKIWLLLMAPRSRKWRLRFLIPCDAMCFFNGQTVLGPILLLRLLNTPFCWSSSKIGIFRGSFFLVSGVGSVILLGLLPRLVHKSFVILVAFVSIAGYMALFGFAESTDAVYVCTIVCLYVEAIQNESFFE